MLCIDLNNNNNNNQILKNETVLICGERTDEYLSTR